MPLLLVLLITKVGPYGDYGLLDTTWLVSYFTSLASGLDSWSVESLVLVSTVLLFWRGSYLAEQEITPDTMGTLFQSGVVVMLVVLFLVSGAALPMNSVSVLVPVYFLFGLLGVGLIQRERIIKAGGTLSSSWMKLLLGVTVAILIFAFLVAAILSPELPRLVLNIAQMITGWLLNIAQIIMGWFELIITWLIRLLGLDRPPEVIPEPLQGYRAPSSSGEGQVSATVPEWLPELFRWIFLVTVVIALVFAAVALLTKVWRWLLRPFEVVQGATVEPIQGGLKEDLLAFLLWILNKLLGVSLWRRFVVLLGAKKLIVAPTLQTVAAVYRDLLRFGAAHGHPRSPSQTPYEYLNILRELFPPWETELLFITDVFVRTRYSEELPSEEESRLARERWRRLKQA